MANDSVKDEVSPFIVDADILSSSSAADNSSTYDVEEILSHRVRSDGIFEYYVKWQGFPSSSNTWEPAQNFLSQETVREYHDKKERERKEKREKRRKSVAFNDSNNLEESSNMDGREIPFIPEKVLNIYQNDKGNLITLVKFRGRPDAKFVPADWANNRCPGLVIEFYESRIYWTIDGKNMTKHMSKENKVKK